MIELTSVYGVEVSSNLFQSSAVVFLYRYFPEFDILNYCQDK